LRLSRPLCTFGLYCLLLGACADTPAGGPEHYVVRPQDTLYSIAWRHDLDFRDLARWNNIGADFRISVGQVLVLSGAPSSRSAASRAAPGAAPGSAPGTAAATAASRAQDAPQVGKPRALAANPRATPSIPTVPAVPTAPTPAVPTAPGGAGKWVWPTDRVGALRAVPGGGILLSGRLGQDVRAASAGRVVYTGSGLRGYGNLIIIKHVDSLLSAYAHNREMLVHDGQEVSMGQVIGHMGEGTQQSPVLYFEIRLNGRPIDPAAFLSNVK
jgi:lipoprotein NlpD